MNALYTLSTRVASDNTAEVLVRFYAGRTCDQNARTGIRVPVSLWQGGSMLISKRNPDLVAIERQREFDALTSYLYDAYTRSCGHIYRGWLQSTITAFHGLKSHALHTLADYALHYPKVRDAAPNTVKRYKTLARDLSEVRTLYVETAAERDIQAFADHLRARGACQNTISAKLKSLRAVFNLAIADGTITANPFARYKIPTERYGSITYLTAAERDALYHAPMPTQTLAQQRDVFVFQCWTGCRISDLYALQEWNVTADGYLQYIQHKLRRSTPTTVRVPLSPVAMEILARYEHHRLILPLISMAKYNEAIKRIIIAAGIDRDVIVQDPRTLAPRAVRLSAIASSHLARRTFAEIAFAETGSERIVSSMTGHSPNSTAFRRYTEVSDAMKRAALKIPDKFPT